MFYFAAAGSFRQPSIPSSKRWYTAVSVGLGSRRLFSLLLAHGACSESAPRSRCYPEHVAGVIRGRLDMCTGGVWQTADAGKGLRFAGDTAHTYRNSSDQTVHFHSLIHYPRD